MHALGLEFGSAAQLSKRPGSVWNCLWGNALKRSPGIIRNIRVSYPGPGFLSSATWPPLPKKHYNGLNQTKPKCVAVAAVISTCVVHLENPRSIAEEHHRVGSIQSLYNVMGIMEHYGTAPSQVPSW